MTRRPWSDAKVLWAATLPGPALVATLGAAAYFAWDIWVSVTANRESELYPGSAHPDAWGLFILPLALGISFVMLILGGAASWIAVRILKAKGN